MTAEEKANLLNTCLLNIHDTGAFVKTLTFDGAAFNILTARHFETDLNKRIYWFPHPSTN